MSAFIGDRSDGRVSGMFFIGDTVIFIVVCRAIIC